MGGGGGGGSNVVNLAVLICMVGGGGGGVGVNERASFQKWVGWNVVAAAGAG